MILERFILASGSPRRRDLLMSVGLDFDVLPANTPEILDISNGPADGASKLAIEKAEAVAVQRVGKSCCTVLGADTIVAIEEAYNSWTILGKPKDRADAKRMLCALSDKEHSVFTGYAVINKKTNFCCTRAVETRVRFRKLSDKHIELYLADCEWSDKAGAYAIQGIGASLIHSINGSYTNVIGLPLSEVLRDLQEALLQSKV